MGIRHSRLRTLEGIIEAIAAMHSRLRTLEEAATRTEAGQLGTLDQQSEEAMEYVHLQLETLIQTKEAMEAEVLKKRRAHKRIWLGWQELEEGEPTPREAWGDAPTRALLYNKEERSDRATSQAVGRDGRAIHRAGDGGDPTFVSLSNLRNSKLTRPGLTKPEASGDNSPTTEEVEGVLMCREDSSGESEEEGVDSSMEEEGHPCKTRQMARCSGPSAKGSGGRISVATGLRRGTRERNSEVPMHMRNRITLGNNTEIATATSTGRGTGSGIGRQDYDKKRGPLGREIQRIQREDAQEGVNPPTFKSFRRDKLRGFYYQRAVKAMRQRKVREIDRKRDYGEHVHWEHRTLPTSNIWVDVHSNQYHQVDTVSWKYLIRLTSEETSQVELFGSNECNSESIDSCISQWIGGSDSGPNTVRSWNEVRRSQGGERRRTSPTNMEDERRERWSSTPWPGWVKQEEEADPTTEWANEATEGALPKRLWQSGNLDGTKYGRRYWETTASRKSSTPPEVRGRDIVKP